VRRNVKRFCLVVLLITGCTAPTQAGVRDELLQKAFNYVFTGTTDPKDAFIPIRRMFNWIENTIILTSDRDIDSPVNRRFVDLVRGTITAFLNALIAPGALVDGKIEFRADENPTIDLADGIVRWHVTLTPPSPAQSMEFITEYDPAALASLFA